MINDKFKYKLTNFTALSVKKAELHFILYLFSLYFVSIFVSNCVTCYKITILPDYEIGYMFLYIIVCGPCLYLYRISQCHLYELLEKRCGFRGTAPRADCDLSAGDKAE